MGGGVLVVRGLDLTANTGLKNVWIHLFSILLLWSGFVDLDGIVIFWSWTACFLVLDVQVFSRIANVLAALKDVG